MKLRRHKKTVFRETGASSDIAFLLIIYFLVIAGFNISQGFLVNLPERGSTRVVQKDELLRFEMDSGGEIIFQGEEIGIDGAEREISAAAAKYPDLAVVLSIDGGAPWQQVVYFVELAQKLNVEAFSFSMRERS